jgi:HrpA-like RNA helicase
VQAAQVGPSTTAGSCWDYVPSVLPIHEASQPTRSFICKPITLPYCFDNERIVLVEQAVRNLGPQAVLVKWDSTVLVQERFHHSSNRLCLTPAETEARNEELAKHRKSLAHSMKTIRRFVDLKKKREELTINQHKSEIIDLVSTNDHCILVSGTGSGKTTQLPQIILDDAIIRGRGAEVNIICTQPRVMAATSVARRVSDERTDGATKSVGHHVRFDYRPPKPGGSILYCTTGVFLMQMRHSPEEFLNNVSHIIVDETHERDISIDTLLALMKSALH